MPANNRFRHQQYTTDPPPAPYRLLPAPAPIELDSDEYRERMLRAGDRLRDARVTTVYLLHGTFVGNDTFGLAAELERVAPSLAGPLRDISKALVDAVSRGTSNYTRAYAQRLDDGINAPRQETDASCAKHPDQPSVGAGRSGKLDLSPVSRIDVRLFHWSSENHHLGRADGAIRLIDELASLDVKQRSRILLCGHSHAGNVFALVTNLLAGDLASRKAFFQATRRYYGASLPRFSSTPLYRRVRDLLLQEGNPLDHAGLDFVTFGTPIRYGWDSGGYDRLLHVINHRPAEELPEYRAPFPIGKNDLLSAARGDCIQQLAIAGTNLPPNVFRWRAFAADRQLGALLQPGFRRRDLLKRLGAGRRVPDEGTTLLVDYGQEEGAIAGHHAGHAVYTREEHLLFHMEEIARRFYDE